MELSEGGSEGKEHHVRIWSTQEVLVNIEIVQSFSNHCTSLAGQTLIWAHETMT